MFKDFSIFSSGGHLVNRRGTILAILVGSHLYGLNHIGPRVQELAFKANC